MLAERRQRLEKDRKDKEDAEKANQKAKAESQREAIDCNPTSAKAQQADYAKQQRKRKYEAKLERERILRDIENNKTERKVKEERRKALAHAEAEENDGVEGLVNRQSTRKVSQQQNKESNECAVQVRLFDGSTIRRRFPVEQSLRIDVRSWIVEQTLYGEGTPYTFKQILTPKPNRNISIVEEEQSLYSLGFFPSVVLVMLPVQEYTSAYSTGDQSIFFRGVFAAYSMVNSGFRMVTGALGAFLGIELGGTNSAGSQSEHVIAADPAPSIDVGPQINVRTLRDQHEDGNDHQLYNGNQVSQKAKTRM